MVKKLTLTWIVIFLTGFTQAIFALEDGSKPPLLVMPKGVSMGQDTAPAMLSSGNAGPPPLTESFVPVPTNEPPQASQNSEPLNNPPPSLDSAAAGITSPSLDSAAAGITSPSLNATAASIAPPSINSAPAGTPLPTGPVSQSEAAQFQNWLDSSKSHANFKPPPPPSIGGAPPKLRKKIRRARVPRGRDAPLVESPNLTYEEQKEMMLGMAPPAAVPPSPDSDIAFNSMMQQNTPLTPQQVIKLRQLVDTSQRAAAVPPTVPPKPVSTTLMINLAPGSTPPAIRLAQGYISSLVFVDSTGAPWPIAAYDIGDPKIVTIQWDGKSNIMMMQATAPYVTGNLVFRLVGLETPVTLELVSGQRVVDYRTDIHVPGVGPNAKDLPIGTGLPDSANQLLLNVLDGVAPPGSRLLTVTGGDAQAWLLADKMFLRTRFTVLSPGWIGKMSSPDGMMAYEIQRTSSVLISQYGNPIELKVGGF